MRGISVGVAALMFCNALWASEALDVTFYEARGENAPKLLDSLNHDGPIGDGGVRVHADTRWNVRWTFQPVPRGNSCEIQSVETELHGTMILPKWTRPRRASEQLVHEWTRYSVALRRHEDGHYHNGVVAAKVIQLVLAGMSGASGCKALARVANRRAEEVIKEFGDRDVEYDAATKHGVTQGAYFNLDAVN
jgi:predicted secreted Zn-dependent protease